jgi:hypothetical protein
LQVLIFGPIAIACACRDIAAFGRTDHLLFFTMLELKKKPMWMSCL